ncbi:hypothetical protein GF325_15240 [Candidatus Bathyarchaeota archaeon]|nr:hypothetical protein [Candidatus Bathyarchaeota archaeon]
MKYYPRLWVELDHRIIGGMTPVTFYKKMFSTPGLVQNCWDRIILGSATPTLEASQLSRGIWEATSELPFNLKSLLRTWLMRNAYRIFKLPLARIATGKSCKGNGGGSLVETQRVETANGTKKRVVISHELNLQSFSITQLLWLQPWILESWRQVKDNFQNITVGNLLLRSYHTTTSILMNEHERGNYLQLHYDLAASTREDASTKLHTVAAEENRADFNYPDHMTASSVGNRQVLIPIKDDSLDMGGRENYYILVTFGPRAVKLLLKYDLILDM